MEDLPAAEQQSSQRNKLGDVGHIGCAEPDDETNTQAQHRPKALRVDDHARLLVRTVPMPSDIDASSVPGELIAKFQNNFDSDHGGCAVQGAGGGVIGWQKKAGHQRKVGI